MESYMQKIGLIRDDINPINMDLIGLFEEFNSENVSQIIFYHACNVLMDMSSITCELNQFIFCQRVCIQI